MAGEFSSVDAAEHYAWLRIAGHNQNGARVEADRMAASVGTPGEAALRRLERTRQNAGAYYRDDDALLAPDFAALERRVAKYGDPEEQLRLAYHEEADLGGPEGFAKALDLYRMVRDQRVASVRLRIGNEYLLGANGFPRDPGRAATWYGFAARAGSVEACTRLAEMKAKGAEGCQAH
jgi:TPR repeat protein